MHLFCSCPKFSYHSSRKCIWNLEPIIWKCWHKPYVFPWDVFIRSQLTTICTVGFLVKRPVMVKFKVDGTNSAGCKHTWYNKDKLTLDPCLTLQFCNQQYLQWIFHQSLTNQISLSLGNLNKVFPYKDGESEGRPLKQYNFPQSNFLLLRTITGYYTYRTQTQSNL